MKFGTGVDHRTNTKTPGSKYKNDIRTSKHIYKQTNIPDFQLCYPGKCLARYTCSPIIIVIIIINKFHSC